MYIYGSPKYTFSYEKKGCPLATTKNPITFRFSVLSVFSSPNSKIFLGKGAPYNPPNRIRMNFDRKGTEIVHLRFPQMHILLWKEGWQ